MFFSETHETVDAVEECISIKPTWSIADAN